MSNSLSPKKTPFNQETLERLLVALRQPFSIAVFASLAAHGLLWAALPNLFSDQQKDPEPQRRVQVVELSPAEQSHLPSLGINPVPTLLPTKPLPPVQSGTKLPDPTKLYNDSSLDSMPVFPLPPPNLPLPDFSNLLPKTTPETKRSPQQQARASGEPKSPSPTPTPATTPSSGATTSPVPGTPSNTPSAAVGRPTQLPEQTTQRLLQEGARSRQLRDLYQSNGPDSDVKALAAAKTNSTEFKEVVSKIPGGDFGESRYNNADKVNDLFPKEACPYIQDLRRATVGAIIEPGGQLAEASLLRPSGIKGLDNIAIDHVKAQKFSPSNKYQVIRVEFTFDPKSSCKSATSTPS